MSQTLSKEVLTSYITMFELARLKCGNLDPELNVEFDKASMLIDKLSNQLNELESTEPGDNQGSSKLLEWFDSHSEKINWGASALDANAISQLNEALTGLRKTSTLSETRRNSTLNWRVREVRYADGNLKDCFVEAPPVEGMAYGLEVLGDDYTGFGDIEAKYEHCKMIVAWANNVGYPTASGEKGKEND